MDITAFIRELLFGHDCVIIPGFGGFIGNYSPARLDKNERIFHPPLKQISFNKNLNHNDGLLIGRISEFSGLNYRDARNLVENFAGDLRRKLEKGEKVVFDNIGTFVNNHEGNVLFEPDNSVNYHLGSYGFESFECLPVGGFDVRKRIAKYPQKEPSRHISMRKLLWRAAIVIPLLALMVAVPMKTDLFRTRVEIITLNPLVIAELEHNKSAIDDEKSTDSALRKDASAGIRPEATPAPAAPALPKNEYFVITGSFKSEINALLQASSLRENGFNPEVVEASNGFYRVCAMLCDDFGTALQRKDSIAKKYPGSWISRKK